MNKPKISTANRERNPRRVQRGVRRLPKTDMYADSLAATHKLARSVGYRGNANFYFSTGYAAAVDNIKRFGLKRTEKNMYSGKAA